MTGFVSRRSPQMVKVRAIKRGSAGGSFGVVFVDPNNPDKRYRALTVTQEAAEALEKKGLVERVTASIDAPATQAAPAAPTPPRAAPKAAPAAPKAAPAATAATNNPKKGGRPSNAAKAAAAKAAAEKAEAEKAARLAAEQEAAEKAAQESADQDEKDAAEDGNNEGGEGGGQDDSADDDAPPAA